MIILPRRLRRTHTIREMIRETTLSHDIKKLAKKTI